jgi:hypothetical protein
MPKIRRRNVPEAVLRHLYKRVRERAVSKEQLMVFLAWLQEEPEVPNGPWFKRFPELIVCGEGELVKTFLTAQQVAFGHEIQSPQRKLAPPQMAPTPEAPAPHRPSPP